MREIVGSNMRLILGFYFLVLVSSCQFSISGTAFDEIDIIDFHVSLTPNLQTGVVQGEQKMVVRIPNNAPKSMSFSSGALTVFDAFVNGHKVKMELVDGQLVLPLVSAKQVNELVEITAKYSSAPLRGYTASKSGLYTEYFACDWMLCQQENFKDKATVTLQLNLPKKMESVGPGKLVESKWLPNGRHQSTWRSEIAYSPYIYAFAFGDFVRATQQAGNVSLHYVSDVTDTQNLFKLFAPTAGMLAFFEEKAGTPFPHEDYTQLYVNGGSAQEAVSHSVIGNRWLNLTIADTQEDWVIAHELAHQWWGNGVTCSDISEFWLNEGITTFMVTAWKEYRWGRAAYERDLGFSKRGHQKAIDVGMDVPLAYDGKYPSLKIRRAIQYSKGAVFMDHLRSELGDEAFWAGLRNFTSANMGKAVSSLDLQLAFERAGKADLSSTFDEWVYGHIQ